MTSLDDAPLPRLVLDLARDFAAEGGRLYVVGGWVRDALRGAVSKDLDLEVYGVPAARIEALLAPRGFTAPVGKQFAVWRHTREGLDVAQPATPQEAAAPGAETPSDPARQFARAARRRDLRVNAMAFDPLERIVLDPLGGREDLASGRLVAADEATFGEDPLRVLRAARLSAALSATPSGALVALCRALDLAAVPVERLAGELDRILLTLETPWRAIETLDALGQLDVFPPLAALRGVPQDPEWHPEGDVFLHTGRVVDQAASMARAEGLDGEPHAILMWAALCHDLGKPAATAIGDDGRIRSPAHDTGGETITREWLTSLRLSARRVEAVATLVRHHLAPALYVHNGAKARGYRRLARKLDAAGVTPIDLERVARADHLGRTTPQALAGRFDEGVQFLATARAAFVERGPRNDVVKAATLMQRGVEAGPELGRLLERARELQDETGLHDEATLVARLLRERARAQQA
ncbi:MAG: HD domain-containing protein [Myxococcota bacterium]